MISETPGLVPNLLNDWVVIGSAAEQLEKFRNMNARLSKDDTELELDISANQAPIIVFSEEAKKAYVNSDFSAIEAMKKSLDSSFKALHQNLMDHDENAWKLIESPDGTEQMYICSSDTAMMWVKESKHERIYRDGKTKFQADVSIGRYSFSDKVMGVSSYNMTMNTALAQGVLSLIIGGVTGYLLRSHAQKGLTFLVNGITTFITTRLGMRVVVSVSAATAGIVLGNVVGIVVFIAFAYLWEWANKKYTIATNIYNWDKDNDWSVSGMYLDNVKFDEEKFDPNNPIEIPKMSKAGSEIGLPVLPGWVNKENICYYLPIIFQNDNTFFEGLDMSMRVKRSSKQDGFMWAFACERFTKNNKQAADDGLKDPKEYIKSVEWRENPRNFSIVSTTDRIPVKVGLDYLNGATDELYHVVINIGDEV